MNDLLTVISISSISRVNDLRGGWRVRVFTIDERNLNSVGRTVTEAKFSSEATARRFAKSMQINHPDAVVQG